MLRRRTKGFIDQIKRRSMCGLKTGVNHRRPYISDDVSSMYNNKT
jgi:hypothetical protein